MIPDPCAWNCKSFFFFLVPRLRHAELLDFELRVSLLPTVVAPMPLVESSESLAMSPVCASDTPEGATVLTSSKESALFFDKVAAADMVASTRRIAV